MGRAKVAGTILAGLLTASGCATSATDGPSQIRGTAGPVAWEVTDIGQVVSLDGTRMLWSYVVVFKETAGTSVQFERMEHSSRTSGTEMIGGALTPTPFRRFLAANSELRVPFSENFGWIRSTPFGGAATLSTLTVERQFIGADAQGRPITIVVRLRLDRSVGKRATPLPTTGPLPPIKPLTASDLAGLAGAWRGSYGGNFGGNDFDIPFEATIGTNGSVEFGEYDPVTRRFRGSVKVQDGQLAYTSENDSGTLAFHEGGGKRVLFGRVSGPRQGSTASFMVRLEVTAAAAR